MTTAQETGVHSPWISVWLKPRQTIEAILATRPRQRVLLLASLGAMSGLSAWFTDFGLASQLLDWRVLFGLAVAGTVVGIVSVYATGLVFKWIGSLLGGHASMAELRALSAWSSAPSILGLIAILAILVASKLLGEAGAAPNRAAVLLPAIVVVCGLWAIVALLLMLSRVQGFGFWRTIAAYVLGQILLYSILLIPALAIRTFLFQPFNTPSHSMVPTLLDGDYIFVSKYPYGYTHYSIPYWPRLFSGRVFGSEPARGDVVVFRLPANDAVDVVKRVVGLPGDRIQMKEGLLYINATPVTREPLTDVAAEGACGGDTAAPVKRWREILPNGVSYETLDCVANGFYDNTSVYVVPAGHFFVMGDNRDNSTDSRVLSSFGHVPFENIVGRVGVIYYSKATGSGATAVVRSERLGLMVR